MRRIAETPFCDIYVDEKMPDDIYHMIARYWPTLDHIPDGNDIMGGPISGLPDGETLSRLVCDGHVEPDA